MMFGTTGARTQGYRAAGLAPGPRPHASRCQELPRGGTALRFGPPSSSGSVPTKGRWRSFTSVLDFGCGCGRTLRWLDGLAERAYLAGSDIDGKCVSWCAENIRFAHFSHNELLPPLQFADETFDLVVRALGLHPYEYELIGAATSLGSSESCRSEVTSSRSRSLLELRMGRTTWPSLPAAVPEGSHD